MATRMTVQQAANLWRVNRRTILKWIMGKDATGRGKRLVEGEDYEAIDTEFPGRKMYVLLREDYPVPSNVTPIPRKPRGRVGPRGAIEPQPVEAGVPESIAPRSRLEARSFESIPVAPVAAPVVPPEPAAVVMPEPATPAAESIPGGRYVRLDEERRRSAPPVAPAPVPEPEPAPEAPLTAEEAAERFARAAEAKPPKPKPRRRKRAEEIPTIDSDLPSEREAEEEYPVERVPTAAGPAESTYAGLPISEQIARWVRSVSDEPQDQAAPLAAFPRVLLFQSMLATDASSASELVERGQEGLEAVFRFVLDASPMTPEARAYVAGMTLSYLLNDLKRFKKLYPSAYWPVRGQLSGLSGVRFLPPYGP